jgi:hypothetical protein
MRTGGCLKFVLKKCMKNSCKGPHVFLILVNDLKTFLPLLKFIDDIAMSNIIDHKDTTKCSHMQVAADQLAEWSYLNYMNIDGRKTKEMQYTQCSH